MLFRNSYLSRGPCSNLWENTRIPDFPLGQRRFMKISAAACRRQNASVAPDDDRTRSLLEPRTVRAHHRSTIVNLDCIKELHPHFNGESLVILRDGTELKLSRSRKDWLEQWLRTGAA
ncbi:MAG: LytTR family DNA-binding domain-containing protein [Blastocatellia bacterium]|nr:LytTR family DNA-binding domain-containing protein [Blastocatellia bacterium]